MRGKIGWSSVAIALSVVIMSIAAVTLFKLFREIQFGAVVAVRSRRVGSRLRRLRRCRLRQLSWALPARRDLPDNKPIELWRRCGLPYWLSRDQVGARG